MPNTQSDIHSALCFDFGMKSIGVAIGQSVTQTAQPLAALSARDGIPNWEHIHALMHEWQPTFCLVGLPLNMDGSEQQMTLKARKFGQRLAHHCKIKVHFVDERLTTADAKERLFTMGGFKKLSKDKIDSVSACIIYETFLGLNVTQAVRIAQQGR